MNNSIKIFVLFTLLLAFSIFSFGYAQTSDKDSDVFLSFGQSEIIRSNRAESRKEALKECLTDAVRQFVAKHTSKRTFELNYGVLKNKIYDNYNNFLKNYKIKEENAEEKVYKVTAIVRLKSDLIIQKLKNLGLVITPGKKPKLLFLISDSISDKDEVITQSWWFNENPKSTSKNYPLSLKLEAQLLSMGFENVKRDTFISKMESSQISLKTNILRGDIEALRNMHLGDVLIIGTSQIDKKTKKNRNIIATSHLSVKVVNLADATSIANVKKSFNIEWAIKKSENKGEKITEHEALRSFVEEFSGDLVESFLPKWQLSQADIRNVDIDLEGLYSYSDYKTVKIEIEKLQTLVPAIKEYSMQKGLFRWTVELNGNIDQLMKKLEMVQIRGKNLVATATSSNHIVLRIK